MTVTQTDDKPPKGLWVTNSLLFGEIVAIIGLLVYFHGQLSSQTIRSDNIQQAFTVRTDNMQKETHELIQAHTARTDKLHDEFMTVIQTQNARTDKLYDEFLILIKEKNK